MNPNDPLPAVRSARPIRGWQSVDWPGVAAVRAAHTMREGGTSAGPWGNAQGVGGLNLGARCGDDPAHVTANRALLGRMLPAEPVWLDQVHGAAVHVASGPSAAEPRADAAVTRQPGVVLAILTADCLPVLFADRDGVVVGAAHAGWRGLAAGVLENTLAAAAGLAPHARGWTAWLGPAIGQSAYEVGDDVRDAFVAGDAGAASCFAPGCRAGKWQADLAALARRRLARAGVMCLPGPGWCTHGDPQRFYSFRRDATTGRMGSFIWIDTDR
jgi:YfiH family protein